MPGLTDVAREAGAHPIRCPHCGTHFKIHKVLEMMFIAILKMVRGGEKVSVRNFGTFSLRHLPGRTMQNPFNEHKPVKFGDRKVLTFRQSVATKAFMNRDPNERGPLTKKGSKNESE
jgi:nucleoid DNA-binding protein